VNVLVGPLFHDASNGWRFVQCRPTYFTPSESPALAAGPCPGIASAISNFVGGVVQAADAGTDTVGSTESSVATDIRQPATATAACLAGR
jgi:hypothetical protein